MPVAGDELEAERRVNEELSTIIAEQNRRVRALEAALRPFARYAEMRQAKPLNGVGDNVHTIHMNTEFEATITLSDCIAARAALAKG